VTTVVGRDREVAALESFLERGEPRILLLAGEPGIGKTTLWRAAVASADARGFRVLASTTAAAETQLSFTVLRDLLEPAFDEVAEELPQPQRQALAVTLLREEPPAHPLEPGAVEVAFARALHLFAERSRLLVAVDDVQWLDAGSATVLGYALRRIDHLSFNALLAQRPEQTDPLAVNRLDRAAVEKRQVRALSLGAIGRIVHDELGVVFPRPTLHRLYEVSGGNPFFALELARALEQAPADTLSGAQLPVPTSLRQLLCVRLEALPVETLEALTYLSVMGRPRLAVLRAALGGDATRVLAAAADAEVVVIHGGEAWFTHPLLATGVLDLASPQRVRDVHRRLAGMLDDDEERARHLALSADKPDAAIAAALEESAGRTEARGYRIISAELYGAAARLTPATDVQDRGRRVLASAAALFDAGDANDAAARIEALLADRRGGAQQVEAKLLLGRMLADSGRWDDAMRLWAGALEATGDPAVVADIRSSMAVMSIYAGSATDARAHADAALAAARTCRDATRLAYAYAARAMAGVAAGEPSYRSFLEKALELEQAGEAPTSAWDWSPTNAASACALHALDLHEVRLRFGELLARGVESGNADLEQYGSYGLAHAELAAGNPRRASELSDVVCEVADETGVLRLPGARLRAEVETHFGHAAEARTRLEAVISESEAAGKWRYTWQARAALGGLELAAGRPDAAAKQLRAARELAERIGMKDPALIVSLVDEAEAAAETNLLDQAEEALAAARRLGALPSFGRPLLFRADAAVAARRGHLDEAEASLARALADDSLLPLQRGRTMLALGSVQRRLRRRRVARETLQGARDMFEELGAQLWAERARGELSRIGGRAPTPGGLTPSERRIANLVADGKTNKEVAELLVISHRTVESALSQIYRKLDVRSRTELTRKLTAGV
jgi:DNA-binding CsgD family transcriptional regulator/DNA polymerase III delta prime subunit